MRWFLVQIHVPHAGDKELERAMTTLRSARSRAPADALGRHPFVSGPPAAARLVVLIEASTAGVVRTLTALAFLPAPQIREILAVPVVGSVGGDDPFSDLGSGVETQLVEDVVDVGLDGSLGDE
jgi:hypothetical protein